jgi:hypothetical protein
VRTGYRLVAFLSRSVPDLRLHSSTRWQCDIPRGKLDPNRRHCRLWRSSLNILAQDMRLANASIPNQNNLVEVVVLFSQHFPYLNFWDVAIRAF